MSSKISNALTYFLMVVVLTLAVVYPPARWVALGIVFSMGYAIILRRRLLASELSSVSVFLGIVTTLLIWFIVKNLSP